MQPQFLECTSDLFPSNIENGGRKPYQFNFHKWHLRDFKEYFFGFGLDIERFEDIEWEAEARMLITRGKIDDVFKAVDEVNTFNENFKKNATGDRVQTIGVFFESTIVSMTSKEKQELKKLQDQKEQAVKNAKEKIALTKLYCQAGQASQFWYSGSKSFSAFLALWLLTPFRHFEEKKSGFYRPKDTWGYRLRWTGLSFVVAGMFAFGSYQHYMLYSIYGEHLARLEKDENEMSNILVQPQKPTAVIKKFITPSKEQQDEIVEESSLLQRAQIMKVGTVCASLTFGIRSLAAENKSYVRKLFRASVGFAIAEYCILSLGRDFELSSQIKELF